MPSRMRNACDLENDEVELLSCLEPLEVDRPLKVGGVKSGSKNPAQKTQAQKNQSG